MAARRGHERGTPTSVLAGLLALAAPLAAQSNPTAEPAPSSPAEAPLANAAAAADPEDAKPVEKPWYQKVAIGGLLFGDAYAVATHHDPEIENANGFRF